MTAEPPQPAWREGDPPRVDPTTLTTQLIDRASKALEQKFEAELAIRDERLRGIDKATTLRMDLIHDLPTVAAKRIDDEIKHLTAILDERFASVGTQFKERDIRAEREARDNKVAVDAAFAAQKEAAAKQDEGNQKAIDKSERATNESISKLGDAAVAANKALSDKIEDLKGRLGDLSLQLNDIVARGVGGRQSQVDSRASIAGVGAIITLILGVVALAIALGFKK